MSDFLWSSLLSLLLFSSCSRIVSALSPLSVVANKFYDDNGVQYFMKGVAYQLVPDDPLADANQCGLDATLMQTIGVNAIRVYHVDPAADHSGCMSAFEKAGIYVLVDLETFKTVIPTHPPYWNSSQFDAYAAVMDAFQQYNNILGFLIGNENIATKDDSQAAPFLKAAARDMRVYRNSKGYRQIPIGYAAADIAELRPMLQNYLVCGGNSSETIEFFALNSYSWCDPSSYQQSGYTALESFAAGFPVPIFFSETGCNQPGPRLFDDQDAIFGSAMAKDWSGSIIYEWIQEVNNYGLISYGPPAGPTAAGPGIYDGYTRQGTPTPKLPDFTNLSKKWATLTPAGIAKANYNPAASTTTPACPSSTSGGWWQVNGNVPLPTLGETLLTHSAATPATPGTATPGSHSATNTASGPPGSSASSNPSSTPSGTSNGTTGTNKPDNDNHAPGNQHITGMAAGLVVIMIFFTFWL